MPLRLPGIRVTALVLGLVTFAAYAWMTAATPYLLDSAELASASFGLGVAHPPGEPLALLWTKFVMYLPLGSIAFRAGLAQGLAGALAAALLFLLSHDLIARFDHKEQIHPGARLLLAVAASLGFAFSPGVVHAAARPEVYAIASALALGALLASARATATNDRRLALMAALMIGLGMTNHPLLAAAAGLGAVWLSLPLLRQAPRLRFVLLSVGALAAGLLTNLYLLLRSLALYRDAGIEAASGIVWGDARTLSGLWWVLSGKTFLDKASIVHTAADPGGLPYFFLDELTVLGAGLALTGIYATFRRTQARGLASGVLIAALGSSGAALFAGLDPGNPDIRGYLGTAIGALAAFAAVGACFFVLLMRNRVGQTALCALVAIVALGRGAIALGAGGLRDVRAADLVAAHSLGTLPPSAVLFTGNFETAALVSYQRLVEGRRPDVAWVHLGFARGPGYAERVSRAEPDLADVLRDYQQRRLDYAPLEALDRTRPVHIEPVGDFTPRAGHHLRPCGLAWCFERERSNQVQTGSRWPPWMATILWQQATTSPEIFHYLVWKIYLDADFACRARRPEARGFLGALAHQAPEDVWARTLLRDCKDRYRLGFDLLAPRGRGIARAR